MESPHAGLRRTAVNSSGIVVEIFPIVRHASQIMLLERSCDAMHSWICACPEPARHPQDLAHAELSAFCGSSSRLLVLHSTSWRHSGASLVLTFVAVLDSCPTLLPGHGELRLRTLTPGSIARGQATRPPARIGHHAVIQHALRHLALLWHTDQTLRDALELYGWSSRLLHGWMPIPAQLLDWENVPQLVE